MVTTLIPLAYFPHFSNQIESDSRPKMERRSSILGASDEDLGHKRAVVCILPNDLALFLSVGAFHPSQRLGLYCV